MALGALLLMLRGRWLTAGLVASLSVLVRQTNAVVLVFMIAVLWLERSRYGSAYEQVGSFLRQAGSCLLGVCAFVVFVLFNEGVAIGDRGRHAVGLHVGNVYFALFLLAVVALPSGLSAVRANINPLSRSALFPAVLLTSYAIYICAFKVNHYYNTIPAFLHNALLLWVKQSPLTLSLFFVPIAIGIAVVWSTDFVRAAHRVWIPLSAFVLVPESLIEQRYAIIPIVYWMLLRKDSSPRAELLGLIISFCLSMTLVWTILGGKYSL
jgi:hypothetical protein